MNKITLRTLALWMGFILATGCSESAAPGAASTPQLNTDDEKTLYTLGVILGRNVQPFKLKPEELALVQAGLTDAVNNVEPKVDIATYGPKVDLLADSRASLGADEEKKAGQAFADGVSGQSGATKLESGVIVRTITPGTGASPTPEDMVKVHYEGKLTNGTVFDSSIGGEPAEFPLGGVVPCWRDALQKMKKGEKAQVVCPSSSAYGDRGAPPTIPPGATLSFEVELIDFKKP
jgi:FKBP-type peptidyl-prolyl cis-trans isomerase FkpA